MHIFLTGGAGFIGSSVVDRLLEKGHAVTAFDDFNDYYNPKFKRQNLESASKQSRFRLVEGDVANRLLVQTTLAETKPDMVIHLAARAGVRPSVQDPFLYQRVNVEGTLNLLDAAREMGVRKFTFGSTSSVYGINSKVPFSEGDSVSNAVSPYAATKLGAEALCRVYSQLYKMDMAVLRFFSVYGPRGRPDMAIYQFTENILQEKPIRMFGDGSSQRDYTYIDDIVQGVVATVDREFGHEIFNLGESETTSLRDLIGLLEAGVKKRAKIQNLPEQPGDVPKTYADISKACDMLGYRPETKIQLGIKKFVDWYMRTRAKKP